MFIRAEPRAGVGRRGSETAGRSDWSCASHKPLLTIGSRTKALPRIARQLGDDLLEHEGHRFVEVPWDRGPEQHLDVFPEIGVIRLLVKVRFELRPRHGVPALRHVSRKAPDQERGFDVTAQEREGDM